MPWTETPLRKESRQAQASGPAAATPKRSRTRRDSKNPETWSFTYIYVLIVPGMISNKPMHPATRLFRGKVVEGISLASQAQRRSPGDRGNWSCFLEGEGTGGEWGFQKREETGRVCVCGGDRQCVYFPGGLLCVS